ncbi:MULTISPECIES: hypothetical protein [Asanoa]|nr:MULTISPECIES: hypothetical protein [Asanoa]
MAAVRIDFRDGTHVFGSPRATAAEVRPLLGGVLTFYQRGPLSVADIGVVEISLNDLDLHLRRDLCRSPSCPKPSTAAEILRAADR